MPPKLKIKAPPVIISETPTAAVVVSAPLPAAPSSSAPSSSAPSSSIPSCPSSSAPSSSIPSCRQFLSSLSPLEQRVCAIAESHLESSFDLSRSSGYIAWKAKNA